MSSSSSSSSRNGTGNDGGQEQSGSGLTRVQSLRAMFDKGKGKGGKALTPAEFEKKKREEAEREAKEILEARKKAAQYNMTVRAMRIKTKAAKEAEMNPLTPKQEESKREARDKARKFSQALLDPRGASERAAQQEQKQRRATQMLLIGSMPEQVAEGDEGKDEDSKEDSNSKEDSKEDAGKGESERQEEFFKMMREEDEKRKKEEEQEQGQEQGERDGEVEGGQGEGAASAHTKAEAEEGNESSSTGLAVESEEAKKNEMEEQRDRETLLSYLRENHPEKLDEAEKLLQEFKGQLDVLFEELAAAAEKEAEQAQTQQVEQDKHVEQDEQGKEGNGKQGATTNASAGTGNDARRSTVKEGGEARGVAPSLGNDEVDELEAIRRTGSQDEAELEGDGGAQNGQNGNGSVSQSSREAVGAQGNRTQFLDEDVDLEATLRSFYKVYVPSKVEDIPYVLAHFEGREADLFRTLEVKYNVTFRPDGTCEPNNADSINDPFESGSKFAVDVHSLALKERLKKQGVSSQSVKQVLSSGSGMM